MAAPEEDVAALPAPPTSWVEEWAAVMMGLQDSPPDAIVVATLHCAYRKVCDTAAVAELTVALFMTGLGLMANSLTEEHVRLLPRVAKRARWDRLVGDALRRPLAAEVEAAGTRVLGLMRGGRMTDPPVVPPPPTPLRVASPLPAGRSSQSAAPLDRSSRVASRLRESVLHGRQSTNRGKQLCRPQSAPSGGRSSDPTADSMGLAHDIYGAFERALAAAPRLVLGRRSGQVTVVDALSGRRRVVRIGRVFAGFGVHRRQRLPRQHKYPRATEKRIVGAAQRADELHPAVLPVHSDDQRPPGGHTKAEENPVDNQVSQSPSYDTDSFDDDGQGATTNDDGQSAGSHAPLMTGDPTQARWTPGNDQSAGSHAPLMSGDPTQARSPGYDADSFDDDDDDDDDTDDENDDESVDGSLNHDVEEGASHPVIRPSDGLLPAPVATTRTSKRPIHHFPRLPVTFVTLTDWYLGEKEPDRAISVPSWQSTEPGVWEMDMLLRCWNGSPQDFACIDRIARVVSTPYTREALRLAQASAARSVGGELGVGLSPPVDMASRPPPRPSSASAVKSEDVLTSIRSSYRLPEPRLAAGIPMTDRRPSAVSVDSSASGDSVPVRDVCFATQHVFTVSEQRAIEQAASVAWARVSAPAIVGLGLAPEVLQLAAPVMGTSPQQVRQRALPRVSLGSSNIAVERTARPSSPLASPVPGLQRPRIVSPIAELAAVRSARASIPGGVTGASKRRSLHHSSMGRSKPPRRPVVPSESKPSADDEELNEWLAQLPAVRPADSRQLFGRPIPNGSAPPRRESRVSDLHRSETQFHRTPYIPMTDHASLRQTIDEARRRAERELEALDRGSPVAAGDDYDQTSVGDLLEALRPRTTGE